MSTTRYEGGCLCKQTTYVAEGEPINPHLCSCTMCQKASGAPTVAWVDFPLNNFQWNGQRQPGFYQSSENAKRCFCTNCGGALGTIENDSDTICITIASLNNPNLITPNGEQHSYKESAPAWWKPHVLA